MVINFSVVSNMEITALQVQMLISLACRPILHFEQVEVEINLEMQNQKLIHIINCIPKPIIPTTLSPNLRKTAQLLHHQQSFPIHSNTSTTLPGHSCSNATIRLNQCPYVPTTNIQLLLAPSSTNMTIVMLSCYDH